VRRQQRHRDQGFTLVEILIVLVVLGIMATVVVTSVRGITNRGEEDSCQQEARVLATAIEAYFAESGGDSIPATGAGVDRFERTLKDQGYLRDPSVLYDITADGAIAVTPDSRCTSV